MQCDQTKVTINKGLLKKKISIKNNEILRRFWSKVWNKT